ncbi:MAG: hypothetical protein ACE5KV_02345 [Thermoplasmata archaeon]
MIAAEMATFATSSLSAKGIRDEANGGRTHKTLRWNITKLTLGIVNISDMCYIK